MTRPLERILVAIDDSPSTDAALTEAIELAGAAGAALVLAHVTTILGERPANGKHRPHRAPDVATTPLAPALARVRESGVPATTELLLGYTPKQLALGAEELDVDLIVVGSRHLKGLKRAVLGSTSHELLRTSSRPVLVVPAPSKTHAEQAA